MTLLEEKEKTISDKFDLAIKKIREATDKIKSIGITQNEKKKIIPQD